jgi:hypothetical protein
MTDYIEGQWYNDGKTNYYFDGEKMLTQAEVENYLAINQVVDSSFGPWAQQEAEQAAATELINDWHDERTAAMLEAREAAQQADWDAFQPSDAALMGAADGGGAAKFTRSSDSGFGAAIDSLAKAARR